MVQQRRQRAGALLDEAQWMALYGGMNAAGGFTSAAYSFRAASAAREIWQVFPF